MTRFVKTNTAMRVRALVEWSVLARAVALVTGPAGSGKTAALSEIARRDRKAALLTMTPAQRSMRSTLLGTATAFGWECSRQHIGDIDDVLRHRLPDAVETGRCLIIDEAQLLHLDVQRQLLSYYDAFGLPIIFAGNQDVLKKTRANAAAFDQIKSRIAKHDQIRGISAADIDLFAVDFNVEGKDAYELLRRFGAGRNCREVVNLLEEALRLAGEERIRLPSIREAISCLHGPDALRPLFTAQAV